RRGEARVVGAGLRAGARRRGLGPVHRGPLRDAGGPKPSRQAGRGAAGPGRAPGSQPAHTGADVPRLLLPRAPARSPGQGRVGDNEVAAATRVQAAPVSGGAARPPRAGRGLRVPAVLARPLVNPGSALVAAGPGSGEIEPREPLTSTARRGAGMSPR